MISTKKLRHRFAMYLTGFILLFAIAILAEPQQPDPNVQRIQDELDRTKRRQEDILESMKEIYKNGFWFLALIAGLTTALSALRYIQDQRIINDLQDLGKSYKNNIDTTNALMTSIKNALEYYKDAQDTLKKIDDLNDKRAQETERWENKIKEINDLAVDLSPRCKRNAHNDPEIQRLVKDFRERKEVISQSFDTEGKLNANAHFILGFHYRIENKYEDALHEFEMAISLSITHKGGQDIAKYRKLPADISLDRWLSKLQNICWYHSAILYNNLGQYDKAKKYFEEALQSDSSDYQSLAYIPETMFFGNLGSFTEIVVGFKNVIAKVETVPLEIERSFTLGKSKLLELLHLKLGNCYMAESKNPNYKSNRDIAQAEHEYNLALSCNSESLFAKLAIAQLLFEKDCELEKQNELFESVFTAARSIVSRITEAKILLMYYYIMMICCKLGDITDEIVGVYAMRIYELIPRLPQPDQLRIFSPRTKIDLTVKEFIEEVQQFERSTISKPTHSAKVTTEVKTMKEPTSFRQRRSLLEGIH